MYKVVFIGRPGSGKTTIICNWLGLLQSDIVGRANVDAASLLSTAMGRTTAAEVHIRQCSEPSSHIRIDYLPIELQRTYISEVCIDYYRNAKDAKARPGCGCLRLPRSCSGSERNRARTVDSPHLEIRRIVLNMIGLLPQSQLDSVCDSNREAQRQEVLLFGSAEEFCDAMLQRADLVNRRQCDFVLEHGSDFRETFARLFNDINNGLCPTASIPKQINVDLTPQDIDIHLPEYVDEVVDTIGLDASVRDDLRERLRSPSALCVLVDRLENPPSPYIRSLLESIPSDEREMVKRKTSLFINSKWSELECVNGADGDGDRGKEIKHQEIERVVRMGSFPYDINHTIFEDPCGAYVIPQCAGNWSRKICRRQQSSITSYDEEEAKAFRQSIKVHLETIARPFRLADIAFEAASLLRSVTVPKDVFPCIVSEFRTIRTLLSILERPADWRNLGVAERLLRRIKERKCRLDELVQQFNGSNQRHEANEIGRAHV